MMNKNKSGYILILTVLILALLMAMVTQIFNRGAGYMAYTSTVEKRERAKLLALSGVQLALGQLYVKKSKKDDEKKGAAQPAQGQQGQDGQPGQEGAKQQPEAQTFLQKIFPFLNRWQRVELNKPQEGLEGEVRYYIACEDGKFNLNYFYDFEINKFRGGEDGESTIKKVIFDKVQSMMPADRSAVDRSEGDLFPALVSLLKQNRINDVTQLLAKPEYQSFVDKVFRRPGQEQSELVLTDLFTTWSESDGIQPWMFSQSVSNVLGLKGAAEASLNQKKESVAGWAKLLKPQVQWKSAWDQSLGKVYGVELKSLTPGAEKLFSIKFGPKVFSVVSYGIADNIIQKVFAIVVRSGNSYGDVPYRIIKLYWI